MSAPSLLILSFSNISIDARVLRQVRLFRDRYRVTTCGFGPQPDADIEHIELRADPSKLRSLATDALIRLRAYRAAYWLGSVARDARKVLRERQFDVVLSNDLNTVPLALSIADGDRIHFDLHEYFPGQDDHRPNWVKHRLPYFEWLLRLCAANGRSSTAVSRPIAERYAHDYGLPAGVVMNAANYIDAQPEPANDPLRFVYSGIAQRVRNIELVMHSVARSKHGGTLDLYLTSDGTTYLDELKQLAEELGPRIRVLPPVPQSELTAAMLGYDIGIPLLPLTPTNVKLALPNKLFDYVQGRLGVITGPNDSMADLVQRYQLGVVGKDLEVDTFVEIIDGLDPHTVSEWKRNSGAAAYELSAERQSNDWLTSIETIAPSTSEVRE